MSQVGDTLKGIVDISNGRVRVLDEKRIRGPLIDRLVWTAAFHEKVEMRGMARWIIKMLATPLGIHLNGTPFLEKSSADPIPSIAIRGANYHIARVIFRLAADHQLRALTLISCPKESQSPGSHKLATVVAAAIQEGFRGVLQFREKAKKNSDVVLIETTLKSLQDHLGPEIKVSKTSQEYPIHMTVAVFTGTEMVLEKEEVFLWELLEILREQMTIEIEKILVPHFKKWNEAQALPMIQEKDALQIPTFFLRDEIAEALSESMRDHDRPFVESFSALKTET